jgi:two-component system chemotaxis response regulator CheY
MSITRVLFVDDDAIFRSIVSGFLGGREDFEVVTASSGAEALESLSRGRDFQVMITDWSMPEMSGYELVRQVRANERFKSLRIMMLTINNETESVEQALAAGADEYLMKPFDKEMLMQKLALLQLK